MQRILYLPSYKAQQRQFEKKNYNPYPVRMAMECEWHRRNGDDVCWGNPWNITMDCKIIREPENLPFLTLPHPNRVFTRAKEYTSGNYKYLPGTHILSASGCVHGKCIFCVENGKDYQVRPVEDVISEIEECKKLGYKELFDDSATFPTGRWLDEFIKAYSSINGLIFSCNTRITNEYPFNDMFNVGFRMLLFGVESYNQATLDKINKGVKVEDIIPTIKKASEAELSPHICVIFGYPWETDTDAINTLKLVHYLLRKGFAKTAQASFYQVAGETGQESHRKYIPQIYNAAYHLDFWFNQLREIHNIHDLKYLWLKIKKGLTR